MTDSSNTCSRCTESLPKPVSENANYVVATDFAEPQSVEVVYGLFHTEETLAELDRLAAEFPDRDRQALAAEMAHPDAEDFREVNTEYDEEPRQVPFSVPEDKFEWREIASANEVQENDDIALSSRTIEKREVPKTGLVCPECTLPDDKIIWGVGK